MATWEWQLSKHRLCLDTKDKKRHHECSDNDAMTGYNNKKFLTGLHLYSSDASCTALSQVAAPLPQTLSTSSFQYLQHE